mmetsp:Transcript_29248/g.49854  ORF Transcript_29248/g.49854 Transcript_29248/m.49854 type:complete len:212 (-) Transcript_29248:261-896(-)
MSLKRGNIPPHAIPLLLLLLLLIEASSAASSLSNEGTPALLSSILSLRRGNMPQARLHMGGVSLAASNKSRPPLSSLRSRLVGASSSSKNRGSLSSTSLSSLAFGAAFFFLTLPLPNTAQLSADKIPQSGIPRPLRCGCAALLRNKDHFCKSTCRGKSSPDWYAISMGTSSVTPFTKYPLGSTQSASASSSTALKNASSSSYEPQNCEVSS